MAKFIIEAERSYRHICTGLSYDVKGLENAQDRKFGNVFIETESKLYNATFSGSVMFRNNARNALTKCVLPFATTSKNKNSVWSMQPVISTNESFTITCYLVVEIAIEEAPVNLRSNTRERKSPQQSSHLSATTLFFLNSHTLLATSTPDRCGNTERAGGVMETIADRSRSATNDDVLAVEPGVACIATASSERG